MRNFSNKYIFIYSTILVAVVAVVLSVVAVTLSPRQQRNKEVEQKQMLLRTIGVAATPDQAEALYNDYISESVSPEGNPYYQVHDLSDNAAKIIIPFRGTGLWGPIWGYIAFDSEASIVGAVFDHQGETPGLGGEISTDKFAQRFIGKSFKEVAVALKKHADSHSPYEVDAITGGTMTSNGVTAMLAEGRKQYASLLNASNNIAQADSSLQDTLPSTRL